MDLDVVDVYSSQCYQIFKRNFHSICVERKKMHVVIIRFIIGLVQTNKNKQSIDIVLFSRIFITFHERSIEDESRAKLAFIRVHDLFK